MGTMQKEVFPKLDWGRTKFPPYGNKNLAVLYLFYKKLVYSLTYPIDDESCCERLGFPKRAVLTEKNLKPITLHI